MPIFSGIWAIIFIKLSHYMLRFGIGVSLFAVECTENLWRHLEIASIVLVLQGKGSGGAPECCINRSEISGISMNSGRAHLKENALKEVHSYMGKESWKRSAVTVHAIWKNASFCRAWAHTAPFCCQDFSLTLWATAAGVIGVGVFLPVKW